MPESFRTMLRRIWFNHWPCYRGSGGRITYMADDYKHIRVKIPLNRNTRNIMGTIYGGSMYSAIDPFYMDMLMKLLGNDYIVWDKAASIRFMKPGRKNLFAEFYMTDREIDTIKEELMDKKSIDRHYKVELKDKEGKVYAIVEKTVFVRKRFSPAQLAHSDEAQSV